MKPKGLQERMDPWHGPKLLGAWLGMFLIGWGFAGLLGLLGILIWRWVGTQGVILGAGAIGACWLAWRELRANLDAPSWRDWV